MYTGNLLSTLRPIVPIGNTTLWPQRLSAVRSLCRLSQRSSGLPVVRLIGGPFYRTVMPADLSILGDDDLNLKN